ncbi:MAG: alpha/beta fold hydrolase [Actinomycetota bacterium]|nr:alpha/beta fold hydrolase [Actinomycetota bacterium]
MESEILSGAEEFSLGGGSVGALLIHGFTGSPQGMRGLGEYLAEHDVAAEGIRLPGHGTTWQDLDTRRPNEWVEAVEQGYAKLAEGRDKVFLVSLSFGSALAIRFAAQHPEKVAGLVSLAGLVLTKDPRRFLSPLIRRVAKSIPGVAGDIADPDMRELAYDRLPTTAAHFMLQFLPIARLSLPKVTCPLLVMHSHNDHTVHPVNATEIYQRAASTDKHILWLDDSYHVLTLDVDRARVFEQTYEFIKERS